MISEMPPDQARKLFSEHGRTAYRNINNSRPYALDDQATLALAAFAKAHQELNAEKCGPSFTAPKSQTSTIFVP